MQRTLKVLAPVLFVLVLTLPTGAQLTLMQKQALLDAHNGQRAEAGAADMLQLQWSVGLASAAETRAELCSFSPDPNVVFDGRRKGEIMDYFNNSNSYEDIVKRWASEGGSRFNQLMLAENPEVGCGAFNCRILGNGSTRVSDVTLLICNYLRTYVSPALPFRDGDVCSACPVGSPVCVRKGLCASSDQEATIPDTSPTVPPVTRKVNYLSSNPGNVGSFAGGTEIVLRGVGLSSNQFDGGNTVTLVLSDYRVPCEVVSYSSNAEQIVCITGSAVVPENANYFMEVTANDGNGVEVVDATCRSCRFYYRSYRTPEVRDIGPFASTPGEVVKLSGRLYSISFEENLDIVNAEYIQRIVVGGANCNPFTDNTSSTLYGARLSGSTGDISCLPDTGSRIDSMNTTIITGYRGNSWVDPDDNLLSLDNKLRPYTYQTHADIVSISPRAGSRQGGAVISITMNVPVEPYIDDLQVTVGGERCDVIEVSDDIIKCVTGPQPSGPSNATMYYPGGRGLLREVFKISDLSLDNIELQPRSSSSAVEERIYRDVNDQRLFSEGTNFAHRISGFFVPPLDSLYTFNIRSDDQSRLYLSKTALPGDKEQIASNPFHTSKRWNVYDFQYSDPVYLRAGMHYYIELLHNQYPGYWDIGLGAKVHSLAMTNYPYIADKEVQRIEIKSTVVQEQHTVYLEGLPAIQRLTISTEEESNTTSMFCLQVGSTVLEFNSDVTADVIEAEFNRQEFILNIGKVAVVAGGDKAFKIIYITRFGVSKSDIPSVSVIQNSSVCAFDSSLVVTTELEQQLSIPEAINFGFDQSATAVPRYTEYLSLSTDAKGVEDNITEMFGWECSVSAGSGVVHYESYEETTSSTNETSYCGRYSAYKQEDLSVDTFALNTVKYLCFAYQVDGVLPPVLVSYTASRFTTVNGGAPAYFPVNANLDISVCPEWPDSFSSQWDYICINLLDCLQSEDEELVQPSITDIKFASTGSDYWVDEVRLSSSEVTVTQTVPPIRPNGASINYVTVGGGLHDDTLLTSTPRESTNSTNDMMALQFDMEHRLVFGLYNITYDVDNCITGIPLISANIPLNGMDTMTSVERTAQGSPSVGGEFDLEYKERRIRNIPFNIAAVELEQVLELNFPDEGGFSVTREGSCSGYSWTVAWETKGGDQLSFVITRKNLTGFEPTLNVVEVTDGGVWLRPLRGDMLRLLHDQPQVEVMVNGIPSSCSNGECSFDFSEEATPTIQSIVPEEGVGGDTITIYGGVFSNDSADITVHVGGVPCSVSASNESYISCTLGDHSAGLYTVNVNIATMGDASTEVCFKYLLRVDSISSIVGNVGGGEVIVITGMGFADTYDTKDADEIEMMFGEYASTAWLRRGFGVVRSESATRVCSINSTSAPDPSIDVSRASLGDGRIVVDELHSILRVLYSSYPMAVKIGDSYCIVSRSNLTHLECVTVPQLPGEFEVMIRVQDVALTLPNRLVYSSDASALVDIVTPSSGPVYGTTIVSIIGCNFLPDGYTKDDISVQVNDTDFMVLSVNDTYIELMTLPQAAGRLSLLLLTPRGVAVSKQVLLNTDEASGNGDIMSNMTGGYYSDGAVFPQFYYQLEVTGIDRVIGSAVGNTRISLDGIGFMDDLTSVSVNGVDAIVTYVDPDTVEFLTPSLSQIHRLVLEMEGYQVGSEFVYNWSEQLLKIELGDTVTWEWNVQTPGYSGGVFQAASLNGLPLQDGFDSGRTTSGTFSYTFDEPGTYFYATILSAVSEVGGTIQVIDLQSRNATVRVFVSDFEAMYNISKDTDSSGMSPVPLEQGRKRAVLGDTGAEICSDTNEEDYAFDDSDKLQFRYSVCLTPVVESISPTNGTHQTLFMIMGKGFSINSDENMIKLGEHLCIVEFSSMDRIDCRLDSSSQPIIFSELYLSLNVRGLGRAKVDTPMENRVTVAPLVTSTSPACGSLAGGTQIKIEGYGLDSDSISVMIGDDSCAVVSSDYNSITCLTLSSTTGIGIKPISVSSNSQQIEWSRVMTNTFEYRQNKTPIVNYVSMINFEGQDPITVTISGERFQPAYLDGYNYIHQIYIDDRQCSINSVNDTVILCRLMPLPAGEYPLVLRLCVPSNETNECTPVGNAQINVQLINSPGRVTGVSVLTGSVHGGTRIGITGIGFGNPVGFESVTIGGATCVVTSVDFTYVTCVTSRHDVGTFPILVASATYTFAENPLVNFTYDLSSTPIVMLIDPPTGQMGDIVSITGENFARDPLDNAITIGEATCAVDTGSSNASMIRCTLGENYADTYMVDVNVDGIGRAGTDTTFQYNIRLDGISPTEGSMAGQNVLTVMGSGPNPNDLTIMVCDQLCALTTSVPERSESQCMLPPAVAEGADVEECPVMVMSNGQVENAGNYTYLKSLTPVVTDINRTRGGTAGGSRIQLDGEGFGNGVEVTIAGIACEVIENTETIIVCETGASGMSTRAPVMVYVPGKGFAKANGIEFFYIDLWSSPFTWGGGPLPQEGDLVVIPSGQTLLLDTTTPILGYLLVQGGELIFDAEQPSESIELHTQGALVTGGGKLEIGTEDEPFMNKAQIVLYGHVLSPEIPVYGAKTLAVREGTLDLHGKPIDVTWTRLSMTANAGDTMIHLQDAVEWESGGMIVIASTSFSQQENEECMISAIDASGLILTLSKPLEYMHISVQQTISGRTIDTSAEVGYLSRNVIVRGNVNEEWVQVIEGCDREFNPGQFDTQSCFLGRFGTETLSDQFGSQIMIHAAAQNKGDVIGRIEYIEVTHAGQAFRLGRYPIHFHLNGNVSGSYVRGCGVHNTFNRAVTVHAVDYLLIEKNVAYNILGHAYFLEDGIEQHNTIQDNLGIFVRGSSSLLNVDITPATFWIVNPNNIVRRNAAAGGSHFGFWYRLPKNPTGPSATTSVCPRKLPVEEFSGNTAHSFGRYGLWVFPSYHPSANGDCGDTDHSPAVFSDFLSWRNDRGVEFAEADLPLGSLQLVNSIMLDNRLAGVEMTVLDAIWGENGPMIKDTLIVGHSAISDSNNDAEFCTESGIKTPLSNYLTVSGVTFTNFDRAGCYPIQACSQCKELQGGFETRYDGITLENVDTSMLTMWQWTHEHVHRDMDGSLTGTGVHSLLIPTSGVLPDSVCMLHAGSSSLVSGSICGGSLELTRYLLYQVLPTDVSFADLNITNAYGSATARYVKVRQESPSGEGHMALLPQNEIYSFDWPTGRDYTNFTYKQTVTGLEPNDYIVITQNFPRELDFASVNGIETPANKSTVTNPSTAETGDFFTENSTIHYVIKGETEPVTDVIFETYTCFYPDCTPPPPPTRPPPIPEGRPENTLDWSNSSIWPNSTLPQAGEDVYINCSLYVLVDIPLPRLRQLTICGGLELVDNLDHIVEVDLIIIQGGRLVAGYPSTPFKHKVRVVLHGNSSTPEVLLPNGPFLGAKAIGAFGELIMNSEPRLPSKTKLSQTALAGDNKISISNSVEWIAGDEIVITSTTYRGEESEVATISGISGREITLSSTLKYRHGGGEEQAGSDSYNLAAEVGLLTYDITIENGADSYAGTDEFGCRVLVGRYVDNDLIPYTGSAQLTGVEFKRCGQLGYSESFDPRFALAYLNLGSTEKSEVSHCSFHDGFSPGIGIFGTNTLIVRDSVIHNTVGDSMVVTGRGHMITNNLASLSLFPGTFNGRNEEFNEVWTANYVIVSATDIEFTNNVAAGGAKVGIHTTGEDCEEGSESGNKITGNVVHSALHGVHLVYRDSTSACSKFDDFLIHDCYFFGIFSFNPASVWITNSVLINNKAAIYVSVIGPAALSHDVGSKTVRIEDTDIISAVDSFDCSRETEAPVIASHGRSHRGIVSPSLGHVGIIVPSYTSGPGHYPKSPWWDLISYPTISGLTSIEEVEFTNFNTRCDAKRDIVLMTSPDSEDCNHPVHMMDISFNGNVTTESKVYNHEPKLSSVNPADCVDMDCDGFKKVLIKDMDGSFLGLNTKGSLLSIADFEWDGDSRRGIGDYRIPRTMLTRADGSRILAEDIYPKKGIVRPSCIQNADWNMYQCTGPDYFMLVIESLDPDTEVRRLSPIGIGTGDFIDLVNGPQDHGWCGGYTCQERISTFYAIVASELTYIIGLTSTNPQTTAFHLLNSQASDAIVIGVIYNSPQRLDVYYDGQYVVPNNAELQQDGNLQYNLDSRAEQFIPTLTNLSGSNFYDRGLKRLYILIRGDSRYEIRTTPVIQVSLSLSVANANDFFDSERLAQNIAFILGIPESKIRVVEVVRETLRRKRQAEGSVEVSIEIGDEPAINETQTSTPMNTTTTNGTTDGQNSTVTELNFGMLLEVRENLVVAIQTQQLDANVTSAAISEPEDTPDDPTNGVRATPETGGIQPDEVGENTTIPLFFQTVLDMEIAEQNKSAPVVITVPTTLSVFREPGSPAIEGLPFTIYPVLVMYDERGQVIPNLGIDIPWVVDASFAPGPEGAFLTYSSVNMTNGMGHFDNLRMSHPGRYTFSFSITYPPEASNFVVVLSTVFMVERRQLNLTVARQPVDGDHLHLLPIVTVWLTDENKAIVSNTGWRNRTWYFTATAVTVDKRTGAAISSGDSWNARVENGVANFSAILITSGGTYRLRFSAFTTPSSSAIDLPSELLSDVFTVIEPPRTRIITTYNVNYSDIITSEQDKEAFVQTFIRFVERRYDVEVLNVTVEQGSIIVAFFVTSSSPHLLQTFVDTVTADNTSLAFIFNAQLLTPSSIEQDDTYPIVFPEVDDHQLIIILATTIPGGIIIIVILIIILAVCLCARHHRKRRVFNLSKPPVQKKHSITEARFVRTSKTFITDEEYTATLEREEQEMSGMSTFGKHDRVDQGLKARIVEDESEDEGETQPRYTTVPHGGASNGKSAELSTFFVNPVATGTTEDNGVSTLGLESSMEEIWGTTDRNNSSNNNNGFSGEAEPFSLPDVLPSSM